jgi:hypothetical protein
MALSKEKVEAHVLLDKAIDALTAAYRTDEDKDRSGIQFGYLLIVGEMTFILPEDEEYEEDGDEEEVKDIIGSYSKRGQSPTISYGLAHEWIRHYNDR